MRKWAFLAMVSIILANFLWFFINRIESKIEERNIILKVRNSLLEEANRVSNKRVLSALAKLQRINRLEDLEEFSKEVALLAKNEREAVSPVLRVKLFEANFRRAELYLLRAGNLLRADENHPKGSEYVERAKSIYDKMEKLMELGVSEQLNDTQGNARINYLKGVYFFRQLIFIKEPKKEMAKVEELVGQSAKHFSMVFGYTPKDRDTEVAIEILQKKAKDMGAGGGESSAKTRLELLPSNGKNQGPTFAIEGLEEGRN